MISLSTFKSKLGGETCRAAIAGAVFLSLAAAAPATAKAGDLALPLWQEIFNADGTLADNYDANGAPGANGVADHLELWGGIDAVFLDDNLSAGVITDMSALDGGDAIPGGIVYNGTVEAGDDLGNAYVFASGNLAGQLELFGAVEHLNASSNGHVDFEFNQGDIGVGTGSPWPLEGTREDGDFRIRAHLKNGRLASADVQVWQNGGFVSRASAQAKGKGCAESSGLFVVCSGGLIFEDAPLPEVWNMDGELQDPIAPEAVIEAGVNTVALLGDHVEFSSIQIRSSSDISLSSFAGM